MNHFCACIRIQEKKIVITDRNSVIEVCNSTYSTLMTTVQLCS